MREPLWYTSSKHRLKRACDTCVDRACLLVHVLGRRAVQQSAIRHQRSAPSPPAKTPQQTAETDELRAELAAAQEVAATAPAARDDAEQRYSTLASTSIMTMQKAMQDHTRWF